MTPTHRDALIAAYAPERIGKLYGVRDPIYTMKGYHRGQDVRRQAFPGGASIVTQVIAIDDGEVVYVARPNDLLGLTIVIKTRRGRGTYESHSHLADASVKVGDKVVRGQRIARNANMSERPGLVTGIHDHITITDFLNGAWMNRPEYDPLPYIQAARAAALKERQMIETSNREIQRTAPQRIEGGAGSVYLRLTGDGNNSGNVTAAMGALVIVSGVVHLVGPHTGGPFDEGGYVPVIQLEVRAERVDAAGNVTGGRRIGKLIEWFVSAGNSFPAFPLDPFTLAAGERLRFRVAAHGVKTFTITEGSIALATTPIAK